MGLGFKGPKNTSPPRPEKLQMPRCTWTLRSFGQCGFWLKALRFSDLASKIYAVRLYVLCLDALG